MKNKIIQLNNQERQISVRVYESDTPKFAAIIMHGMAEHDGRYDQVASKLAQAGGYVLTYNHRGHGQHSDNLGDIQYMDALIQDAHFVASHLPEDLPKIIIGHSMGSVVARHMMRSNQYRTFIIIGTLGKISFADHVSAWCLRLLAKLSPKSKLRVVNYLALDVNDHSFSGEIKNRWLSKNVENVKAFNDDVLCGFKMTTGSIYETLHYAQSSVAKKHLKEITNKPDVLFVSGTDDAIANSGKDIYRLGQIYHSVTQSMDIHMYPTLRHEVLNEDNHNDVVQNIIDWINNHV